ncbi:carboxylating nicotinate-nucleotide diphosphorylase [Persephonella sp.]
MLDRLFVRKKLEEFLLEDIGHQDITTDNLPDRKVEAQLIAKEEGVLAGIDTALQVMDILDSTVSIEKLKKDGDFVHKGEILAVIRGNGRPVLKGERVMLNLLQRMSGIASNTRKYVDRLKGTSVKILDTRKTTPGLRAFEKYAVKVGGGGNHRFALYDMVMIKDNHISLVGSIKEAVRLVKEKVSPFVYIEVEVSSVSQLEEALETEADIIMLDNFSPEDIKKAVKTAGGKKKIEVSGNITLENITEYAVEGVDFISSGALIHSAKWMDISLKFK